MVNNIYMGAIMTLALSYKLYNNMNKDNGLIRFDDNSYTLIMEENEEEVNDIDLNSNE